MMLRLLCYQLSRYFSLGSPGCQAKLPEQQYLTVVIVSEAKQSLLTLMGLLRAFGFRNDNHESRKSLNPEQIPFGQTVMHINI